MVPNFKSQMAKIKEDLEAKPKGPDKMKLLAIQELLLNEVKNVIKFDPKIAIRMVTLMQELDKELNLDESEEL